MKDGRLFLLLISIGLLIAGCKTGSGNESAISFDTYKIADGFEIQLAASEPLIEAPVVMDFDNQGRIWVVEMRGYMPNLAGEGEDAPNGRISILEDFDQAGTARRSKVFLDSLVLPRALAHVYGGLLYAAPPNLWFVEIKNDKPGKKTLVDSLYSDGGNPENQPNGLLMGIDNWIYSANSTARYQLKDGKWLKEPASFRGQWGISQDNFGRLYYNYNEIQITGDYVLPNTFIYNPYLKPKEALNKLLTENQRVYPLHPTTVNRGYVKGILNQDSILVNFTAACGPLVYRGDQFPDDYKQNVFVCEPEANLVKRNILSFGTLKTTATQAWDDREFIASTDEGFRPVNLLDAPDGAMYIVDMHRGILQHRADETPYYRNGISHKKLDTLINAGRILRIKYKNKRLSKIPDLDKATAKELVDLLKSSNGWVRDHAQQQLIYRQDKSVAADLQALVKGKDEIAAIHALHVLDGLSSLSFEQLEQVCSAEGHAMLTAHALLLLEQYNTKDHIGAMESLATSLMARKDTVTDLYLAVSLGPWGTASKETFLPLLQQLSQTHANDAMYQEAVVSSLKDLEEAFRSGMPGSSSADTSLVINELLSKTIQNKQQGKMNSIYVQIKIPMYGRQNGLVLFRSTCATCHGPDGEGIQHLAPPLNGSEYVERSVDRLGMIIMNGLSGPIHVNGQLYQFNGAMPTFGSNLTDRQIADIIEYLHNSFVPGQRPNVKTDQIKALREKKSGILTEKDLLEMPDPKH